MLDWVFQKLVTDQQGLVVLVRRLILEQGKAHRGRYAFAFLLMGISAACTALSAYLFRDVINAAYVQRNFGLIIGFSGVVLVLFTIRGVTGYGQAVMMSRIANRIVADNQRNVFRKLLQENLGFYANRHSSEFIARLNMATGSAAQILNMMITAVGRDILTLFGLLIVMVVQDPVMSLAALVVGPPAILVLRKMTRRVRNIARDRFTGGTRTLETMQETLQGIRIVKAFTLEDTMRRRFDRNVADVEHESNKMARVANRSNPLMETLGGAAVALAMVYGGYRVVLTNATPGEFFSFIMAFLLAYEPAKRLARFHMDLNSKLIGLQILYEILDSPTTEPDDADLPALAISAARVELADVRFGYRPNEPVIRNLSFVAEPGQSTALVGHSGGGKSTILNLILRFYDVEAGTITIDGQDITKVARHSLRHQVAYVGQDVFLFRGTVRDNIAFGKQDATEDQIIAAAKAAYAHDFIMSFPESYDTPVGERGLQLSGGQRQRIAIARALVKDSQIILLDEATASLNSESERQVQKAIEELCKGRTTIVIAHRLSTVMHADRILVIENGMVVEAGRHDELMRKNGRYAAFYRLQLKEQEDHEPVPLASHG